MIGKLWDSIGEMPCGITPGTDEDFWFQWTPGEIKRHTDNLLFEIPESFLAKAHLLDVGCGEGRLMTALAPKVFHYYGVDISKVVLDRAMVKSLEWGYTNTSFYHLNDEVFEIPEFVGRFGVVVCFTVFMHLSTPVMFRYLKQIYRYLNRGGYFNFQMNGNNHSLDYRYDIVDENDRWRGRWYPDEMIVKKLEEIGFVEIRKPVNDIWRVRKA
jgi:cyclopropane fatty-acyl-phospholipid synthase-like methyltransferase